MGNYVLINGDRIDKRDELYKIIITKMPDIIKPEQRIKMIQIDGRNGAIIERLGYQDYTKSIELAIIPNLKYPVRAEEFIRFVVSSINDEGEIVFSTEPEFIYIFKQVKLVTFEKLGKYYTAKVDFLIEPFKYDRQRLQTITQFTPIRNMGNIFSQASLDITMNAQVDTRFNITSINGRDDRQLIISGTGENKEVTYHLDGFTGNMWVTETGLMVNTLMSGDIVKALMFPLYKPSDGSTTFQITSSSILQENVVRMVMKDMSRYI